MSTSLESALSNIRFAYRAREQKKNNQKIKPDSKKTPKKRKRKKDEFGEPYNLVVQHNYLIEARYELSLLEKKIMSILISKIKMDDSEFLEQRFTALELMEILGIHDNSFHKKLKDVIDNKLMAKTLSIRRVDENSTTVIHWVNRAKYWHNEGTLDLKLHEEIKPYLLDIQKEYTKIGLKDILGLSSLYAVRLLELLKQYQIVGERTLPLNELRKCFGLKDKDYKNYADFKRKTLQIAIKEINGKTDLWIEYKEIKQGRRVHKIQFFIKENPYKELNDFDKLVSFKKEHAPLKLKAKTILAKKIKSYGISHPTAYKYLREYGEEAMFNICEKIEKTPNRTPDQAKKHFLDLIQELKSPLD